MTDAKHTPEPWKAGTGFRPGDLPGHVYAGERLVAGCRGFTTNQDDGEHCNENDANAARIVACVNALAGYDPAVVREVVGALERAADLAEIASDWHLEKVEINGKWVPTYGLAKEFRAALSKLRGGGS